jgi:2-oxoisovalerate dehydrogenase E2 component (dihydrolipoyl transacylase)
MKQFKLPDVGEGLTEAEIVSWKVKPGDTVKVNEIVVEIETAKSLVELPSPFAGVVAELLVEEGTTVDVGTPIITVDDGSGPAAAPPRDDMAPAIQEDPSAVGTPTEDRAVEPGLIGGPAPGGRTSVLVGYGPRTTSAVRRPRKGATPEGASAAAAQQAVQTSMMTSPTPVQEPTAEQAPDVEPAHPVPPARAGARPATSSQSRRCASWRRTSESTWPRSRRPARAASSPAPTSRPRRTCQPENDLSVVERLTGRRENARRGCRSRASGR